MKPLLDQVNSNDNQQEYEAFIQQLEELRLENQSLSQQNKQLQNFHNSYIEELQKQQEATHKFNMSQNQQDLVQKLESKLEDYKQENQQMQEVIESLENYIQDLSTENARLDQENQQVQTNMAQEKKQIQDAYEMSELEKTNLMQIKVDLEHQIQDINNQFIQLNKSFKLIKEELNQKDNIIKEVQESIEQKNLLISTLQSNQVQMTSQFNNTQQYREQLEKELLEKNQNLITEINNVRQNINSISSNNLNQIKQIQEKHQEQVNLLQSQISNLNKQNLNSQKSIESLINEQKQNKYKYSLKEQDIQQLQQDLEDSVNGNKNLIKKYEGTEKELQNVKQKYQLSEQDLQYSKQQINNLKNELEEQKQQNFNIQMEKKELQNLYQQINLQSQDLKKQLDHEKISNQMLKVENNKFISQLNDMNNYNKNLSNNISNQTNQIYQKNMEYQTQIQIMEANFEQRLLNNNAQHIHKISEQNKEIIILKNMIQELQLQNSSFRAQLDSFRNGMAQSGIVCTGLVPNYQKQYF